MNGEESEGHPHGLICPNDVGSMVTEGSSNVGEGLAIPGGYKMSTVRIKAVQNQKQVFYY